MNESEDIRILKEITNFTIMLKNNENVTCCTSMTNNRLAVALKEGHVIIWDLLKNEVLLRMCNPVEANEHVINKEHAMIISMCQTGEYTLACRINNFYNNNILLLNFEDEFVNTRCILTEPIQKNIETQWNSLIINIDSSWYPNNQIECLNNYIVFTTLDKYIDVMDLETLVTHKFKASGDHEITFSIVDNKLIIGSSQYITFESKDETHIPCGILETLNFDDVYDKNIKYIKNIVHFQKIVQMDLYNIIVIEHPVKLKTSDAHSNYITIRDALTFKLINTICIKSPHHNLYGSIIKDVVWLGHNYIAVLMFYTVIIYDILTETTIRIIDRVVPEMLSFGNGVTSLIDLKDGKFATVSNHNVITVYNCKFDMLKNYLNK